MRAMSFLVRAFLIADLLFAFGAVSAKAQDKAEMQAVSAANDAVDKALSARDIGAMDRLWAHEPYVIKTDPSARSLNIGWEAVRKSWELIFDGYKEVSVSTREPQIHIDQNVAWIIGVQTSAGTLKDGNRATLVSFSTNIYEKKNGQWLMVAHITSRVPSH
jgi:ketosteroid isomerase-like protein